MRGRESKWGAAFMPRTHSEARSNNHWISRVGQVSGGGVRQIRASPIMSGTHTLSVPRTKSSGYSTEKARSRWDRTSF